MSAKTFLAAMAALLLVACSGPELRQPVEVTSAKPPLAFDLAEIEIEDATAPPADAGFRDRMRSEWLVAATTTFLDDRLSTGSGAGWLQVTIDEARLLEQALEIEGTAREAIARTPDRVLDALIRVRLAVMGPDGLEQSFVEAEVQRRRPILRNTSVMARDAEANRLIGDLMLQFDDELTAAIRQHLNAYLL